MLRIVSQRKITSKEAEEIGEAIGINWSSVKFTIDQFMIGLDTEHNEHGTDPETDVTHGDKYLAGKIAWAHLKEFPDYYTRLRKMENS